MAVKGVSVGVVVMAAVLLTSQLAFTSVGQEIGARWTDPVDVAALTAGPDSYVTSLSAAGDDTRGAVAWISRRGDQWRVSVARLAVADGQVTVTDHRTLASSSTELADVGVAVTGDAPVVVWERTESNEVVLATGEGSRVISAGALRVAEPDVATAAGTPVVAWQAYLDGGYRVVLATVRGDGVDRRTVGGPVAGEGSPAVAASKHRVSVTWVDSSTTAVVSRRGTVSSGGVRLEAERRFGRARPAGGFGGSSGSVTLAAAAGDAGVRAVWTDLGTTATVAAAWNGSVGSQRSLGTGARPGVAVRDERWLAAWLVQRSGSGSDVVFHLGPGDERGDVSRLASSASHPRPVFAPDPGVVWVERGGESRVVASALRERGETSTVARLRRSPGRFAFVGLGAAVIGAVTAPVLPWAFFALLGGFAITARVVRSRVVRAGARLVTTVGRPTSASAVEGALRAVPAVAWAACFAAVETWLLVMFLPASFATTAITFSNPLGVSALAAGGTLVVARGAGLDSAWRLAVVFVYLQSAALWTTALPAVM